ncbi:hypothetical protein D9M68_398240 [compost metagenome]
MLRRLSLALPVIVFFVFIQKAQATVGCLVGSTLHTSTNGSGSGIMYYNNSPSLNASGYCLRNGTGTTPCQLRSQFILWWIYGDSGLQGDYGPNNPPAYCPIDEYVPYLLMAIAGTSLLLWRRQRAV